MSTAGFAVSMVTIDVKKKKKTDCLIMTSQIFFCELKNELVEG